MLLQEKCFNIHSDRKKSTSFIIERFIVPDNILGLKIALHILQHHVQCVFVYDSDYNLRLELNNVVSDQVYVIHEEEIKTSKGSKSGKIPAGEWIIAIETSIQESDQFGQIVYKVEGIPREII